MLNSGKINFATFRKMELQLWKNDLQKTDESGKMLIDICRVAPESESTYQSVDKCNRKRLR